MMIFFYFLQIRRAKVFHPSIFLSVTAAQGYSELSRFHQCTPEKKIRFVGTQLQADMSLHCAQMSRYSRHQIFSILFRFTYI